MEVGRTKPMGKAFVCSTVILKKRGRQAVCKDMCSTHKSGGLGREFYLVKNAFLSVTQGTSARWKPVVEVLVLELSIEGESGWGRWLGQFLHGRRNVDRVRWNWYGFAPSQLHLIIHDAFVCELDAGKK